MAALPSECDSGHFHLGTWRGGVRLDALARWCPARYGLQCVLLLYIVPHAAVAHPLDLQLRNLNAGFRAGGLPLQIERRGQRLGLRGRLPRRSGVGHGVQRISLGLKADASGLELAVQQLQVICGELASGRFSWDQRPTNRSAGATSHSAASAESAGHDEELAAALQRFQTRFHQDPVRRRHPAGLRSTWSSAYRPYLQRLQRIQQVLRLPLGMPLLLHTLDSYPVASRSRQQCGTVLAALAHQQGLCLPQDWGQRAGGYGLHRVGHRALPSDQQILAAWEAIPNRSWRWVFGAMATYGLRNHEVFFCDRDGLRPGGDQVVRVLGSSKTGEHQSWPFPPEWVQHFQLQDVRLPAVTTDLKRCTLQAVGRRVTDQFRRYSLGFSPYDLRHAWAVRTIHLGLPDTVAARMMGHSVAIHTRTYHHWITRRDQQQAVDAALARRCA